MYSVGGGGVGGKGENCRIHARLHTNIQSRYDTLISTNLCTCIKFPFYVNNYGNLRNTSLSSNLNQEHLVIP